MLPFSANPVINSFQKNETLSGAAPVWPMTFTFGLFTSAKFPKNINDCTEEPSAFHKAFDNVGLLQQLQQTQTSFSHQDSRFSQGVEKFIYKPLLFSIWEVTEKKKKGPGILSQCFFVKAVPAVKFCAAISPQVFMANNTWIQVFLL